MRGTNQVNGGWTLEDLKAAAAEVLAAQRAEQVVDPVVFDISRMPASLKQYWLAGAGAAVIGWGTPGDFDRCVTAINAEITKHGRAPLPDHEIKGLCANLHKEATGATPGNAQGESHHAIEDPTARMAVLIAEFAERRVKDAAYWGKPVGTPITPGMRPQGHKTAGPARRGGSHGDNRPKGSPSNPPGWGDPNPKKFADYIRAKYKLPAAKEDNAIRSDLPASQLPAVKAAAVAKVSAAAKAEPAITKAVTGAVAAHGGTMDRFDQRGPKFDARLKSADSMERKIADGVMEHGLSPDQAAAGIRDSVRFTAVVPTKGYWQAGTSIGDNLEAAGYQRVKQSRGWDLESVYAGRNDTFNGPDGVEFEVQFHTAESLAATQRNHDLYNMSRRSDTPPAAVAELQAEQKANVPLPDDLPAQK